jgi:hypothetical protein
MGNWRMVFLNACLCLVFCLPGPSAAQIPQIPRDVYLVPVRAGVGVGRTLQLTVVSGGRTAEVRPEYNVIWKSSDTRIALVDRTGRVTGRTPGTVTVSAEVALPSSGVPSPLVTGRVAPNARMLSSVITVGEPVASVRLTPSNISMAQYCAKSIEAQPLDRNGQPLTNRPVSWRSSAPQIVRVQPRMIISSGVPTDVFQRTAQISALQVGSARIDAVSEGVLQSDPVSVVRGDPTSLWLTPDQIVLDVLEAGNVQALARNQDGCVVPSVAVTWQIADPTVASATSVSSLMVEVRGLRSGTTTLTATTQSGLSASVSVTVPAVSIISLDPTQIAELDIGARHDVAALLLSSTGTILRNRSVTWAVSGSAITLQPSTGERTTVTGRSVGSANIVASSEGASSTAPVTVPSVATIAIDPQSTTLTMGSSATFHASPRSSLGTALGNRTVTWGVSNTNVSLGSNTGYAVNLTGTRSGDATLTARSEGVSGSTSVHVRTYCETNICASRYRVDNLSDKFVDVYLISCSSLSCTYWEYQETVPPGFYFLSASLTENASYQVRAVVLGRDANDINYIKMDSAAFFGGPGSVAIFEVF